jgi:hypothetical protein
MKLPDRKSLRAGLLWLTLSLAPIIQYLTRYFFQVFQVGIPAPVGSSISLSERRPARSGGPTSLLWIQRDISFAINRPKTEAEHSSPNSTEVKKRGFIYPLPYTPLWCSD